MDAHQVMGGVDGLDLFAVYRQVRCRLVVVSAQQSMARAAAGAGTGAWSAYERWVLRPLERVAAANPAVALVGLPTGHDPHVEAPEVVASPVHTGSPIPRQGPAVRS
jgi:hypothetical protein